MPQEIVGSMQQGKLIGFNANKIAKGIMDAIVVEQNERFAKYADNAMRLLGDAIQLYHSRNNMDRTGNLLDSLCWGVSYQGKLVTSGFYRPKMAKEDSGLHEWSKAEFEELTAGNWVEHQADEPVNGHALAEQFIQKYGNKPCNGWKVFFAILAPYWGYWEKGFKMKSGFTDDTTFTQFAVMAEFYDKIKGELKPAKVSKPRVSVPKYASKSLVRQARKNYFEGSIWKRVPKIKAHYTK